MEEGVAKNLNEVSSSEDLVIVATWDQLVATETPDWHRRGASSDQVATQSASD